MPYLGLSSFLQQRVLQLQKTPGKFQCPTSGFLLFYIGGRMSELEEYKKFQCPTSGFLLFYAMSLHPLILLALQIHFCV